MDFGADCLMDASTVSIVVPAAGRSARFGAEDKLRVPWQGTTILQSVLDAAWQCGPLEVILVTASPTGTSGRSRQVQNPEPDRGLASSIAAGVRAASDHATGFLVWPADMPLVTPDLVRSLVSRGSVHGAIRPKCEGIAGHPVLFGSAFREALEQMDEGPGARHLLTEVTYLGTQDRGVIEDIDTPAAYERLRAIHA